MISLRIVSAQPGTQLAPEAVVLSMLPRWATDPVMRHIAGSRGSFLKVRFQYHRSHGKQRVGGERIYENRERDESETDSGMSIVGQLAAVFLSLFLSWACRVCCGL